MSLLVPDKDVLDLLHESVHVQARDGIIRRWNKASEDLYGWTAAEALGRPAKQFFDEIDVQGRTIPSAGTSDGVWSGEARRRTRLGEELLLEVRRQWWVDPAGGSVLIETARDITRSRAADEALRKSEHRYRNLFQAMAASFWELDFSEVGAMLYQLKKSGAVADFADYFAKHPEFVRDMMRATRVVDVNDQTVALFGRGDKHEMLTNVEPYFPEASTDVYAGSVVGAISNQLNYSRQTRLRTIDGQEFPALFTACFPPDTMNKGTLLVGVIDLSREVAAQTALAQMQSEMAHAARVSMLGELAASIAHEVNQPLAAIAANASAGLRWLQRDVPDLTEVNALTARIVADARRAADIVGRIRDMASGVHHENTAVQVNAVVSDAAVFLRHEIQSRDARVTLALAGDAADVLADRIQLQQVIVNLAVNALQAMDGAGTSPRWLTLRTANKGERVVISVEDNGPGIRPENLPRLFDSFFTTRSRGMGMGLAIARSIIQGFSGTIRAENRPDQGARFIVDLPALPATSPGTHSA